ncbi:MAG TPA: hypothetical protein VGS57_08945 [Thermoanaerobaculia bacterium]|nr:hypothetical protein [Thermoanaerobaculia bacterium]
MQNIASSRRHLALVAGFALAALVAGCGGPRELASHWRDRDIVVDGKLDEWSGLQTDLAAGRGQAPARVGIVNDGEALWLSLQTSDPNLERLVSHRGLTIWFDPAGGKQHVAGVRFPLPAARPLSRWGEIGGSRPGGAQLDSLELLGPQPYTRKELSAPGGDGVQVAMSFGDRSISYELRVPLAAVAPAWGIGVKPGALIGVGVQSKGIEPRPQRRPTEGGERGPGGATRPDGGEPPEGDQPPGDDGGTPPEGDGPRGGRGRGPYGHQRPGAVQDFEVWSTVRLASGSPASAPQPR